MWLQTILYIFQKINDGYVHGVGFSVVRLWVIFSHIVTWVSLPVWYCTFSIPSFCLSTVKKSHAHNSRSLVFDGLMNYDIDSHTVSIHVYWRFGIPKFFKSYLNFPAFCVFRNILSSSSSIAEADILSNNLHNKWMISFIHIGSLL